MSQEALTLAVTKYLQEAMGKDRTEIDTRPPPGKPAALAGEQFIAVCDGSTWSTQPLDFGLDETFSVAVVVTRRVGYIPDDRTGTDEIDLAKAGLNAVCAQVRAIIHGNPYDLMGKANDIIGRDVANGFVEPLRMLSVGGVESKGMDWFSAVEPEGGTGLNVGFSRTMVFGGARRVQGMPAAGYALT